MRTLRLSSFGVQGSVGDGLTPELVIDVAAAFGTFLERGPVLVGRDTRQSSRMFHSAVVSGLLSTGCDVLDFGVCPTPMLQFSVGPFGAAGAISISGGHSPMGHNALQLIGAHGASIEPVVGETVLDIYHARDFTKAPWNRLGNLASPPDFAGPYFDSLAAHLQVEDIRRAGLTVVIDPVNGAGCRFIKPFAERLGLRLLPVNDVESGYLAHDPEPRPRNARQAAALMSHIPAAIGFISSSDMGRLSLVSESGETASEEYTFPIIANHVLSRQGGVVVTNCCTTRTVDDVAAKHGATVVKTRVGQAYVISAMADENGVIGGEGNGSVALPTFSRGFDAFLMMGLILEAMATRGASASDLIRDLPRYHIVKRQAAGEAHRGYRALDAMADDASWHEGGTLSALDGLRVDWEDGWLHLRASQTAPIVRIISESRDKDLAENRALNAARLLEHLL
jgi:phosphomannomutase